MKQNNFTRVAKFCRVVKFHSAIVRTMKSHAPFFLLPLFAFDFLTFFLYSSHFIPVIVFSFVYFSNLYCFGWYIIPKQHFVKSQVFYY